MIATEQLWKEKNGTLHCLRFIEKCTKKKHALPPLPFREQM